jgi:ABC-type multidrug transport system fused ATPase/permease subunit
MTVLAADITTKTAPKIIVSSIIGCILTVLFAMWLFRKYSSHVEIGDGKRADIRRMMRLLARFTEGSHKLFIGGFLLLSIEAVTTLFGWYPLTYLIDYFVGDQGPLGFPGISDPTRATVALMTLLLVIVTIINSASDSVGEILFARGGRSLGFRLRTSLFSHLQRLPLAFHDSSRKGDMTFRVVGDVKEFEQFVIDSLSDLIGSILLLIATVIFLLYEAWQIMLVGVIVIPGTALISWYFSTRIKEAAKRQRAREGDLAAATHEMLNSIRVVQTFGRGGHDERSFVDNSGRAMDAALRAARLDAWFSWIVNCFEAVAIAAVLWIGVELLQSHQMSLGTLTLVTVLIRQMFKPSRKVIKEWNVIAKVFASVERIADLLDRPITVQDEPGSQPAPRLQGGVEFRHVTFAYAAAGHRLLAVEGDRGAALQDVSFRVEPGEVVAISGPSGAGKTTIAQLIPRLYDPQEGAVLLDGHDVREFTLDSIRSQVSMVLQDALLLSGSVADNIAYGKPDATREQIVAAAIRAHADEFVSSMPEGYDTDLTEQASNLSAGQRQRIAIARALIRDTPILILDEPTTGLDNESSDAVLAGLRELMRGRTTLVISHDLDLVASADRILMIDGGRLSESGTHRELLERQGLYAALRRRRDVAPVGGLPAALPAANGDLHVDARHAPTVRRDAPALSEALDADAMAPRIRDMLRSEVTPWTMSGCHPGKALYLPGEGCMLRYVVPVTGPMGTRRDLLLGARVCPDAATAAAYHSRIAPLAARLTGRREVLPLKAPSALLDGLAMVVQAFPIDAELPALIDATDSAAMAPALSTAAANGQRRNGDQPPVQITVEKYPRQGRCTLRYDLNGSGEVLYGKLRANAGVDLVSVHDAVASIDGLDSPRVRGVVDELGLVLLDPVPGDTTVARLLRHGAGPAARARLEAAMAAAGTIAGRLHRSGVPLPGTRTLDDELGGLHGRLAEMRELEPGLVARLEELVAAAAGPASEHEPLPLAPSHGDFTPSQVMVGGEAAALLDLDDACQAEAALDLGRFCAYLRVACRKALNGASADVQESLCARFLDAYAATGALDPADRPALEARLAAYEAAALAHIALQGWLQLKPARTLAALGVLEERAACLSVAAR